MTTDSVTLESSDERLCCTVSQHTATLLINRSEKLNALDDAMVIALGELCQQIERQDSIRAVVLTGTGEKSFCAGGDIDAWSDKPAAEFGRFWIKEGQQAFERLARLRQPVIAVLNGHTLGGGLELAACADFRIAEAHVKLGQPEAGLGIIPGWSGTQRMVRRFGAGVTRRMALFGEIYAADEAHSLGLVDLVCESGQGVFEAQTIIDRICARGPLATELTKMLINVAEGEESSRVIESLAGVIAADSSELASGLDAFRNKRKPEF